MSRGIRKGLIFEKYADGRQVIRKNGRFAKFETPPMTICPECGRIHFDTIEPQEVNGFIDPRSMKPKKPSSCASCGYDFMQEDHK